MSVKGKGRCVGAFTTKMTTPQRRAMGGQPFCIVYNPRRLLRFYVRKDRNTRLDFFFLPFLARARVYVDGFYFFAAATASSGVAATQHSSQPASIHPRSRSASTPPLVGWYTFPTSNLRSWKLGFAFTDAAAFDSIFRLFFHDTFLARFNSTQISPVLAARRKINLHFFTLEMTGDNNTITTFLRPGEMDG